MTDPLKAFLQANALTSPAFAPDSRYHGLDTAQWTAPDGTPVTYVRRRFVPPPERFATLREHVVEMGDRLDNLAAHYLGDPQQYWRLCDGNGTLRPEELTDSPGRRLRITLPEGVPGGTDVEL
ncbi:LysM domain-containing protein [Halomonas urmiana]|uniref:LysM domain-containing protein n=1 Tax=Halomonas urmiana TaxID=490901 RepID=A0A5R8ML73_9GAMM|nr:LysM domain-containing protein [Halomonas urmiana]TLF52869.1 LysM domain-containing protein [Halomonas urmiana]